MKPIKAWHFCGDTLRDGRAIPADGEKLIHTGDLELCASGFHASKRILDTLKYAPGSTICRVELSGTTIECDDKLVASERTILWRIDGEYTLWRFARMCALDVVHLWDAPDAVLDYLRTGDEELRAAARAAAGAAAGAAAWAAGAAAGDAAKEKQNSRLTQLVTAAHKRRAK